MQQQQPSPLSPVAENSPQLTPGVSGVVNAAPPAPAPHQPPAVGPTPLPKRPKGRKLVAFIIFLFVGAAGYWVYDTLFASVAKGNVQGRIIRVSAPWEGIIDGIHVREGDKVRTGELIVSTFSTKTQDEIESLQDRLRIAQAELNSQIAIIKLNADLREDDRKKFVADYYRAWGELLAEKSKLADINQRLNRSSRLLADELVSDSEHESLLLTQKGQVDRIKKLEHAVKELKARAERSTDIENKELTLKPRLIEIESLQEDLRRLRKREQSGRVTSPVNGTIVKIHRFAGERTAQTELLVEILEEGSTEIELFITQKDLDKYAEGSEISLVVAPFEEEVLCRVERLGLQFRDPPSNLTKFYLARKKVLPVYLKPIELKQDLILHSEVNLPRRLSIDEWMGESQMAKSESRFNAAFGGDND